MRHAKKSHVNDSCKHGEGIVEKTPPAAEPASREAVSEVAQRIVEARTEQGMTQAELAEACGMKAANLCRIETGKSNPSVETLNKIANGMGRKLDVSFI